MRHLLTFVLLAFACYRITRLAIVDTIFDNPRDWVHAWLLNGNDEAKWRERWWAVWPASVALVIAGVRMLMEGWVVWLAVLCFIVAALMALLSYLIFTSGPTWLGHKIEEMISCPYCLSVWVAMFLQLIVWPVRPIPLPALYFLALSGAGMVIYQYIDFEPEEEGPGGVK